VSPWQTLIEREGARRLAALGGQHADADAGGAQVVG